MFMMMAGNRLQEIEIAEHCFQGFSFILGETDKRKAELGSAPAAEGKGALDGDWIGVKSHEHTEERIVVFLNLKGFIEGPLESGFDLAGDHPGDQVGGYGNNPGSSHRHEGYGEGVIPGKNRKVCRDRLDELVDPVR